MERLTIPLLAVDGGGTKCHAVFADRQQQILGSGKAGACNYQGIGKQAAVRELIKSIQTAMDQLPASDKLGVGKLEVECAVFGIAGLDTEYDRRIIVSMVQEALDHLHIIVKHLVVENDGLALLLGATNGQAGVLVIAGTGSIAFGINEEGVSARAGGWGHRVGDEGSGYWIGKQAIISVLHAADGRGPATELGQAILTHLGLGHPEQLFNWSYSAAYAVEQVANLSQLVSAVANQGDAVAKDILTAAAEALFLAARAVIDRLHMKEQRFAVILQGGVLQNNPLVRQMVLEQFRQYAPSAKPDSVKKEPIYGVIAKGIACLEMNDS